MDGFLAEHNKELVWTDNLHRGFIKLELDKEKAVARYVAVSNFLSEKYEVSLLKRVEIVNSNGEVSLVDT